jgi:alkaline phosphatase D
MFGDEQMEWLKNSLLGSQGNVNISFRIIATGSQVLNPYSPFDCFHHYPDEYNELINFIKDNNINGVVFLTGDRHHSEIIKADRTGTYPLYDITSSPLTSSPAKTFGEEIRNPSRVGAEIDEQNYTRFSFSGPKINRKMTVEFLGTRGQKLGEWSVMLKDISVAK